MQVLYFTCLSYLNAMNRVYQLGASALYISLFFMLFPWYRYVIDIDAISYIHVAQRIANGDYYHAVNGYWSPLISWILVPFIQWGYDPVLAAKYINGVLGLLSMMTCYSLLDKFRIHDLLKKILPFFFAILFVSYAFYELCADLLQLFLLLLYINLIFSRNFINDHIGLVFAGILGALCYYAKAYSFPFFLLHFIITVYVLLKKENATQLTRKLLSRTAIAFITFFLLTLPYIAVISHKYGSFRINNAGKLNTSWFLSPGISDQRKMVAEPPFGDATSYWDDPTYAQEKWVGPFTSFQYFLKEIKWTISNCIKFANGLSTMSVFAWLILTGFIIHLIRKKKDAPATEQLLLITSILYPSGYLLIFIEWRYIWLLPVTFSVMGAILLTNWMQAGYFKRREFIIAGLLLALSFCWQPVNEMKDLKYSNKDVYEMAEVFKKQGIKGNLFLHYKSFPPYGKTVVLSYLTGCKFYGPVLLDYDYNELMTAAKKYHVQYFLFFYDYPNEKEMFLQSPYARSGIKVFDNLYPGLIVVQWY